MFKTFKGGSSINPLWLFFIAAELILMLFEGCAPAIYTGAPVPRIRPPSAPGIYYKVVKGDTLWSIAKRYSVDVDDLAKANSLQDNNSLESGRNIFIPGAKNAQPRPSAQVNEDFIWPLKGSVISRFGDTRDRMIVKGINIRPSGKYEIVSSRGGRVVFYGELPSYGKTLIIDHGDGFSTVYAGNQEVYVKAGDDVKQGMEIAKLSSSDSREAFLHFEIRKGYVSKNPSFYLP